MDGGSANLNKLEGGLTNREETGDVPSVKCILGSSRMAWKTPFVSAQKSLPEQGVLPRLPFGIIEEDEHTGALVVLEALVVMAVSVANQVIKDSGVYDVQETGARVVRGRFLHSVAVALVILPPGGKRHPSLRANAVPALSEPREARLLPASLPRPSSVLSGPGQNPWLHPGPAPGQAQGRNKQWPTGAFTWPACPLGKSCPRGVGVSAAATHLEATV